MDYEEDLRTSYCLDKEEVNTAILFWLRNREREKGERAIPKSEWEVQVEHYSYFEGDSAPEGTEYVGCSIQFSESVVSRKLGQKEGGPKQ